jgi:prepilin-type processing-associated H-X9-DG protein
LVLPAVMRVRETASRLQCANNLKQLAIGCHSFESAKRRFPYNTQEYYATPWRSWQGQSQMKSWSWIARVLPYIEQDNLYKQTGMGNRTFGQSQALLSEAIPLLFCPSDAAQGQGSSTDRHNLEGVPIGLTNYKGVSGSNWCWGVYRNAGPSGNCNGLKFGDGLFFRDDWRFHLDFPAIRDGASNTFMIGEDIPSLDTHCSWPYANNAVGTCAIPPNLGVRGPQYPPTDWTMVYSFRSSHPGGLNFAFADGSVRWINETISLSTYRALATIRGGEAVSDSNW